MPVTTEGQDEQGSIIHDGKQSMVFLLFFSVQEKEENSGTTLCDFHTMQPTSFLMILH